MENEERKTLLPSSPRNLKSKFLIAAAALALARNLSAQTANTAPGITNAANLAATSTNWFRAGELTLDLAATWTAQEPCGVPDPIRFLRTTQPPRRAALHPCQIRTSPNPPEPRNPHPSPPSRTGPHLSEVKRT